MELCDIKVSGLLLEMTYYIVSLDKTPQNRIKPKSDEVGKKVNILSFENFNAKEVMIGVRQVSVGKPHQSFLG